MLLLLSTATDGENVSEVTREEMFQDCNVLKFDSCHVHSLSNVSSDVLEVMVTGRQMKRTLNPLDFSGFDHCQEHLL